MKIYSILKIGIFHCYVGLPWGFSFLVWLFHFLGVWTWNLIHLHVTHVTCLTHCLGVSHCFSPPVRWGLLDFMSVSSPSPPPLLLLSSSSASLSICCVHVMCRTSTAILWVQCGVPDLNRDPVSSVWRPGPQPRSREFSVASRTSTAILWVQCGVPDLNRDPVSSVWRPGRQVMCQKICQKECQKLCQKECQKKCQKDMSEDMSERMSKDMSERCQKECQKICQICQK